MKVHLAKVSLALLSTVFLLGCQEQGSGPVGPGPEFHHSVGHDKGGGGSGGGETEATSYMVTHAGDISTNPSTIKAIPHPGKPGKAIHMGKVIGEGDRIVLSDAFVSRVPHSGREACFPKTVEERRVFDRVGILIRLRKNKEIEGQYVFSAFGTDGETPVNYNLAMTGTATGDPFAPDPGQTTTVTWDDVLLGAQRESEVSACAADGSDRTIVDITGLQLDVEIKGDPVT